MKNKAYNFKCERQFLTRSDFKSILHASLLFFGPACMCVCMHACNLLLLLLTELILFQLIVLFNLFFFNINDCSDLWVPLENLMVGSG